jgi:hypothetical protein
VVHRALGATVAAVVTTAMAGVRAEDEAAEEDRADDEYDACDDADPRGDLGEPAGLADDDRLGCRRRGWRGAGLDGSGLGFGRRRCFAHEVDDDRLGEVPVMNRL